jgi:hypothetical protein
MLKAVVDTNIIVSGTISTSGAPFEVLEGWRNHKFMLVTSKLILKEVERVFGYPHIKSLSNLKENEIKAIITVIKEYSIVTPGKAKIDEITADPDDNMFLVCAKEAEADFIVSGDKHLLSLRAFQGIPIMTARQFIETLKQRIG